MKIIETYRGIFAAQGYTLSLRIQHCIVQVLLRRREFARNGVGPRDVCNVTAILATGVNEDHFVLVENVVVADVVDAQCVPAPGHDGDVRRGVAAVGLHLVLKVRGQVLFLGPRLPERLRDGAPGHLADVAHESNLRRALEGSKIVHQRFQGLGGAAILALENFGKAFVLLHLLGEEAREGGLAWLEGDVGEDVVGAADKVWQ